MERDRQDHELSVPAPWTPVCWKASQTGVDVDLWGRTYRFNQSPLPCSIQTAGLELLGAPIRLVSRQTGADMAWMASNVSLLRGTSSMVQLSGGLEQPGFWVSANVRIEYDGMLRFDLVVAPWRKSPHSEPAIEQLWLEIPLRSACASLFSYWPANMGGAVQCHRPVNSGGMPRDGFMLPFKPFIWLGWEEGGLGWFAESDRGWQPADPDRAMEVVRCGDQVLLRLCLLDSAPRPWQGRKDSWGEALAPLTLTFGLQATPVKPWPGNAHAWRYAQLDYGKPLPSYQIEKTPINTGSSETILDRIAARGVRIAELHEKWTDIQNYWATSRGEEIKATVRACHDRNIKVIPYLGYEISTRAPEWADLSDRVVLKDACGHYQGGWQRKPTQRAYMVCYNNEWQDRWLEGVEWMLDEYGFDGVYLDGTPMPWGCANADHGCGYADADGKRHVTYPIFALRRMFQRLYRIVSQRGGLITAHQSSCCCTPVLGYCHSYWDGEHLSGDAKKSMATVEGQAVFRAEFMGRNFGVPCEFLGGKESLAYTLLHDVLIRPNYADLLDAVAPVWTVFERFGVDLAEWHPYWRNRRWVEVSPDLVKASLYIRRECPGQHLSVLIVIANTASADTVSAAIRLGSEAEAWSAHAAAKDAVSGISLEMDRGAMTLELKPLEFRLIWIEA